MSIKAIEVERGEHSLQEKQVSDKRRFFIFLNSFVFIKAHRNVEKAQELFCT